MTLKELIDKLTEFYNQYNDTYKDIPVYFTTKEHLYDDFNVTCSEPSPTSPDMFGPAVDIRTADFLELDEDVLEKISATIV